MSKLQEKMSEKMFVLFGGISKSLSDIEYAIQQDAEYMKQGNPNNQAKNEMSRKRPENLDYTDVKRERLEEYFMYAADKDVAYYANTVKILKEIEVAMAEYKKALLREDLEKVTEAFQKVAMVLVKEGTGIEVTEEEFLKMQEETEFASMKKESVKAAFEANSMLCRVVQEVAHDNNLIRMQELQERMAEIGKSKDKFRKDVAIVIERQNVHFGSGSMNRLWQEYSTIKEAGREVYNNYKKLELGKAEMEGLGAAIGNLKEFGAKCKAPGKENSTEYTKFEAALAKYKEAEEKQNFPKSTEEKIALVSELREATKEYLDAKKGQFRPFPSGYRVGRMAMAQRILDSCDLTLKQLKNVAEIDKQMEQYKVAIVDKGYTDYDTFYKKVCDKEALYKEKQMAKQSKEAEQYDLSRLFKEPKEAKPISYDSDLSTLFKE
jgi:hypothetical protein